MSGRIDQPTTLRLNKSITTARNSQPSSVATYVMSPVRAALGPAGVKLRFNRFGAIGRSITEHLSSSSRGHLTYRQVCMLSILKINKNDLPDSWLLAVLEFRNLSPVCV